MSSEKTYVIHQRILARLPQSAHGARIDSARKDTDAADDVGAARRSEKHGLRLAHSLIARRLIEQIELRQRRMQTNQHRVWLERDCIAHHVMAAGKIEHAMCIDGPLDRCRVVGGTIAFHSERVHIHPFLCSDGRARIAGGNGAGREVSAQRIVPHAEVPIMPSPGTISP